MADTTEEANRDALNGLNATDRKDTQEIIDEIDAEEAGKKGAEPDDEAKKKEAEEAEEARRAALSQEERDAEDAAAKAAKEAKPDGKVEEKKPDEEKVKPETRRNAPKLMPVYLHKIKENNWNKEKESLVSQIEDLSSTKVSKGLTPEEKEARIKKIAEDRGFDVEFVRDVVALTEENNGIIPDQVSKGLNQVKVLATERELETEEANFSADFDRLIVPLIKQEYGDDVSPKVISDIKEDLKGLAYSDEYAKVPYEVIYRGNGDFRGIIPSKAKGAEGSRGGTETRIDSKEEVDLTKPLPDNVVRTLDDKQFDTYMTNMAALEKQQR